ncbi:long-chain fatty acid transport protein [Mesocricetibacter intestinalis]|uniref:Long-chain fatty acid transport protein n=1 Tax=Mesocricetibacter intestinalis TaxID=1521930 RepID=A0A4R6VC02_9PAST|nr:porin [Mesocricetibacter intestinalis]TDQ57946.1 long-chain fatty acid transport protein [Mesocricetibacter intestinalis]
MKNLFTKTLVSGALLCAANGASAAAFQLAEISTAGLGRAYAGEAAIGDNASAVATNPALMSLFKRPEISIGGVYINPGVNLQGDFSVPAIGVNKVNADYSDAITSKLVPHSYMIYPINDKFALGGGVNVNYGLATEYSDSYNAGIFGGTTDLTAINLNLSGAYRLNEHLSFGLGFNAVHADATLSRRAGAIGNSPLARIYNLNSSSYLTDLTGKDWGYGWNAGLLYEFNERNRIGVAYHSKVDIKFDGNISNDLPGRLGMKNVGGYVDLSLPDYWEISGYHKLTDKFAVHYSYKHTKWSRVERLKAQLYANGQEVFNKYENFNDTSRLALGTSYDVDEKLTLRAGIAFDESASSTPSSISIPDTDRTWYSLGATYRFTPDLSLDFAYTYVKGKKKSFTETESMTINGNTVTAVGNFTSKAQVNLYGLSLNYRF